MAPQTPEDRPAGAVRLYDCFCQMSQALRTQNVGQSGQEFGDGFTLDVRMAEAFHPDFARPVLSG